METEPKKAVFDPWLSLGFSLFFLAGIYVLTNTFFMVRGGAQFWSVLEGATVKQIWFALFPLAGLYAFFLVWMQIMLGSNMDWIRGRASWLYSFHKFEGGVALLFALLHPTLLALGLGISEYYKYGFVAPGKILFIWIGYLQLFLLICAAGTALLRRIEWLRSRWFLIHQLNYLVFILVWLHSWNLGSDVQTTNLRYVWIFMGITAVLSGSRKWVYKYGIAS